jgi:glycosyltransferase involved in cell wall biosynthesis
MGVRALSEMVALKSVAWLPNPLRQPTSEKVAEKKGELLLAVGRLHPQKGYEILLEAFAIARPMMDNWTLRILGSGRLEDELCSLSRQLGIADSVEFLGHVADPFPHYRAADLFVMTSRYEGSPNALWEAMSCGLATIVSDSIEGALEVVSDGPNTRVVPVGNAGALANVLKELAGNPDLRGRLGRDALRAVRHFAPTEVFCVWDKMLLQPK